MGPPPDEPPEGPPPDTRLGAGAPDGAPCPRLVLPPPPPPNTGTGVGTPDAPPPPDPIEIGEGAELGAKLEA